MRTEKSILALLVAAVMPYSFAAQDNAVLQRSDAPEHGVWIDSLDMSKAAIRRPRGQRGSTTPPSPLTFTLGGVAYPHALPLASDGDVAIDLGGRATKLMAMVGIDDSVKTGGSVAFGVWVDGKKVVETEGIHGGATPKMISADLTRA